MYGIERHNQICRMRCIRTPTALYITAQGRQGHRRTAVVSGAPWECRDIKEKTPKGFYPFGTAIDQTPAGYSSQCAPAPRVRCATLGFGMWPLRGDENESMALHKDFPDDPHAILDPAIRWFSADEALRTTSFEKLLPPLVPSLRKEVKAWRDGGYDGATPTSQSLLRWWFVEQHLSPASYATGSLMQEFRYFFAQREALETIVYLYNVVGVKDKYDLMRFDSSGAVSSGMFDESWRRFVVKMATGAGKTKVLALALAWSFFHKLYEADSKLARNFLVIAPNIIVLDRILKDFGGLKIFFQDPVLPDNGFDGRDWRDDFQLTLYVQDDVRVVRKTGNIFLTNIHRVYAGNESLPTADDEDTMGYFLGPRPTGGRFQAGLRQRRRGYFELLPRLHRESQRERNLHRRDQRPGRSRRTPENGPPQAMVRRHQSGSRQIAL